MRRVVIYMIPALFLVTVYSCQKPLDIKATNNNSSVLVVEGFINTADSTKIFLSRTVVIGNKTTANPEGGATITLENASGVIANLIEKAKGFYTIPNLVLDNSKQYRLRIKTSNGKIYLSDLTDAKVTQPIDSVGFTVTGNGITIYANTHDDANKSRYYLYNYEETWRFKTPYFSVYKASGNAIVSRTNAELINYCFGFHPSTNVVLNSTAALTKDVAYQAPITTIDATSEKISIKYSILLTQTALTKEAYAFWENLRTNTEQLGSIFDAQPSQLAGNIHNVADSSEPVIGYISAGTKATKRVFISKADLPSNFITQYPYTCQLDTVKGADVASLYLPANPAIIVGQTEKRDWLTTTRPCADCTIRGRVPQPSFWQ